MGRRARTQRSTAPTSSASSTRRRSSPASVARHDGDVGKALAGAAQRIDAIYQLPFLAHAAMEPMNCTVHVSKDGCDLWVGTQAPTLTQAAVAEVTGLPKDAVRLHNHLLGGGFGRRLEADGTVLAVQIAQQVDGPVKVIWSREEDIQHDMYRPYYYDRMSAGLDADGKPVAWTHRIAGSSIFARYSRSCSRTASIPTRSRARRSRPTHCRTSTSTTCGSSRPAFRPPSGAASGRRTTSSWSRASSTSSRAAAKQDPVAYRRALLGHNPRALGVLDLAAEKAGWGKPLPAGGAAASRCSSRSAASWRRSREVEVATDGSVKSTASSARSIAAWSSIRTRSRRRWKAASSSA